MVQRREQIVEEQVRARGIDAAGAMRAVDWLMGPALRRRGGVGGEGGSGDDEGGDGDAHAHGDANGIGNGSPITSPTTEGELRIRLAVEEVQRLAEALGEGL